MVDLLAGACCVEDTQNLSLRCHSDPCLQITNEYSLRSIYATLHFDLDPKHATTVLFINIFAEVGRWRDVQMVMRLMNDKGVNKILDVVGLKAINWFRRQATSTETGDNKSVHIIY